MKLLCFPFSYYIYNLHLVFIKLHFFTKKYLHWCETIKYLLPIRIIIEKIYEQSTRCPF